jgi:hypothetical protein
VSSLYSQLLTSSDENTNNDHNNTNNNRFSVILPFLVLNYDSALPGTRPYAGCAVVKRGMLAPLHILRTVGRILLGFAFGKTGSGLLPAQVDPRSVPVGVESITASKTKDQ